VVEEARRAAIRARGRPLAADLGGETSPAPSGGEPDPGAVETTTPGAESPAAPAGDLDGDEWAAAVADVGGMLAALDRALPARPAGLG
jgi:hypothetical protein